MSNATEQVQITIEHVGRVWVDRYTYDTVLTAKGFRNVKPVERTVRYVILDVKPADPQYVRDYQSAGPRVEVSLARVRPDGTHQEKFSTRRWLPTTGNELTAEIEVAAS